ncbi:glycosyltransferase [uncultured Micrococcus sp.]|uniref:glycosyltransferase n=1 Tax=uncultured Micrococcus sp. TaxID=114051 RepID=UPI0025F7F312|nr:glycosyltransferase [uncultured Micrococcus sp.]
MSGVRHDAGAAADAPEVSVVVPYYRAQVDLDRLVAALAVQDHPASRLQLVVADDGSPEPPVLPGDLPFASVVVRQEDRGFRASAARALGVRAAEGRVLAFLDGDMLPEPGYLSAACALPAVSADAVVVGRRRHLRPEAVAAGWRPGEPVPEGDLLEEPAWLRQAYAASGDLAVTDATSYRFVISAVLTVAREVYEDAGGFDPAFVGYGGEDWELAHRLWRVGGTLRHEPAAVAWQAGEDFGGREDPAAARAVKQREGLVLASRITATTARGHGLALAGPQRVAVRVRAEDAPGEDSEAAAVVGVDAALQAFPGARVTVTGVASDAARAAFADPRVAACDGEAAGARASGGVLPAPPARGDLAGVRGVPDWAVDLRVPLRPAGRGERPDPARAAGWLLRIERAGVERVEVLGEPGERAARPNGEGDAAARPVLATLTSSRARWRARRGGGPGRVWRVPASRLGWAPVPADVDLEAWWGGWA